MSGSRKLPKDHYIFREGDPSDAMFVIKSGKFAVVKNKANTEIILAEIGPGAMVGEMAFFDEKPRSASVKALKEGEVIVLPFKALRAQFMSFPEWAKAIMRTVNENLRNANKRLKELETSTTGEAELFPPHTITKLISILNFIGMRYGEKRDDGLNIPGGVLRNYTIQVFQEPTHKMQKMMNTLAEMNLMKVEDIGEGRQKIVVFDAEMLLKFVEWYNDWLFKKESDRVTIREEELPILKGILHFAKNLQKNDKGLTKVNLSYVQNESMKELGYLIKMDEVASLVEKKVISEQMMEEKGVFVTIDQPELEKIFPYWNIIYTLRKVTR